MRKCTISNNLSFLCILRIGQPWSNQSAFSVATIKSRHWKGMSPGLQECMGKDSSEETHGEIPLFFQKFPEKEAKPPCMLTTSVLAGQAQWHTCPQARLSHSLSSVLGCSTLGTGLTLWVHHSFMLAWRKHKNQVVPENPPMCSGQSSR